MFKGFRGMTPLGETMVQSRREPLSAQQASGSAIPLRSSDLLARLRAACARAIGMYRTNEAPRHELALVIGRLQDQIGQIRRRSVPGKSVEASEWMDNWRPD